MSFYCHCISLSSYVCNGLNGVKYMFVRLVKWGRSGGAMVLGKLPVPGRPTNLDLSRARACCACRRCRWGVVWTFFLSSVISIFFLPLSGRRPDID